ncbi:hypothetical protein BDR04DRAFT_1120121 [Suillus decipiens]|nr:hypothetical protein BDR04DRAFT_1120121 [Suillus decipiens]
MSILGAPSHDKLHATANHHALDVKNTLETTSNEPKSRRGKSSFSTIVGNEDFYFEKHLKDIIRRPPPAIGGQLINCASSELVQVDPPSGLSCAAYMDAFISYAGGYITNPNATAQCLYCPYRTTDEFMYSSFSALNSHHWRNVFAIFAFTYVFRIRKGNISSLFRRRR